MSVPVAALLDRIAVQPPQAVHPVVVMGRAMAHLQSPATGRPEAARRDRRRGVVAWCVGAAGVLATALGVERVRRRLPGPTAALLGGLALWPLLALELLLREVAAVEHALAVGDLPAARTAVARIVGRDVTTLDEAGVRMAAIESLAENLSDSVVAPLCWFVVAGLPGAALYRWTNTADAVWGHPGAAWRDRGRFAARVDDLANLVPARVTGLGLLGPAVGDRAARHALRREAARTASPNAGWPMGAMALRLDVRLEKVGHYLLHPGGRLPGPIEMGAALRHARRAGRVALLLAGAAEHVLRRTGRRRG